MKTTINYKPSKDISEGIYGYRVYYKGIDDRIMFERVRANSIVELNNKLYQLPQYKSLIKFD